MTKTELIDTIAEEAEISKAAAGRALAAMQGAITRSLVDGEPVSLIGFGTFLVRERGARTGRNPQTGEEMSIAASKAPAFKPARSFKDALN